MDSKNKGRLLSKLSLLLVIFAFFMPISCEQNGFQLISHMSDIKDSYLPLVAVLMMVLFVVSLITICYSIYLFATNKKGASPLDIPSISICVLSAMLSYCIAQNYMKTIALQIGAYFIITGLFVSIVFLIISEILSAKSMEKFQPSLLLLPVIMIVIGAIPFCFIESALILKTIGLVFGVIGIVAGALMISVNKR